MISVISSTFLRKEPCCITLKYNIKNFTRELTKLQAFVSVKYNIPIFGNRSMSFTWIVKCLHQIQYSFGKIFLRYWIKIVKNKELFNIYLSRYKSYMKIISKIQSSKMYRIRILVRFHSFLHLKKKMLKFSLK